MVATLVLEDELDVGRGDLVVAPERPPEVARELEATVCWMVEAPARVGARYLLKHTTRRVRANIAAIGARVDIDSFAAQPATELGLNDIGRITLRTAAPIVPDAYAENRATGAFILIDERTARHRGRRDGRGGAGGPGGGDRALARHPLAPVRAGPRRALGRARRPRGATVWLTGLPASGKSTIAVAVERALVEAGRFAYLLDGDNLRHGLSGDLGFDPASRSGEHPPRRARRAAVRRRGRGRAGVAGVPVPRGPARRARAARGGGAAVRRGVRRHAGRGVRAPRPEGPLRPGPGGTADRADRRVRAVRAADGRRDRHPRRDPSRTPSAASWRRLQ